MGSQSRDLNGRVVLQNGTLPILPKKCLTLLIFSPIIPPEQILSKYVDLAMPFYNQMVQNINQSNTLTKQRDTLLPKLLSGGLQVSGAKELTEDA